jgi:hypothetical protein
MRTTLLSLLLLLPLPALAHVGHLDAVDGHHHYLAAWALLGVIAGSVWLIWAELRSPSRPKGARRVRGPRA